MTALGYGFFFLGAMKRTYVYIDGFNLYYGSAKGTKYKWLNVLSLCQLMLPPSDYDVARIKYFTAKITAPHDDPRKSARQAVYLRALGTLPCVQIVWGFYTENDVFMRLSSTRHSEPKYARVIHAEEKMSDVNLALHMVLDGMNKEYECAALITNDSDQASTVDVVRFQLGLPVVVITPLRDPKTVRPEERRWPSGSLIKHATMHRALYPGHLASCQFKHTLQDSNGEFSKPSEW